MMQFVHPPFHEEKYISLKHILSRAYRSTKSPGTSPIWFRRDPAVVNPFSSYSDPQTEHKYTAILNSSHAIFVAPDFQYYKASV
jgi:hypothetical protein